MKKPTSYDLSQDSQSKIDKIKDEYKNLKENFGHDYAKDFLTKLFSSEDTKKIRAENRQLSKKKAEDAQRLEDYEDVQRLEDYITREKQLSDDKEKATVLKEKLYGKWNKWLFEASESLQKQIENGKVVCGDSHSKAEVLYLCSLPWLTLDLTNIDQNIKDSIASIKGNLNDNSSQCSYRHLITIWGNSSFDYFTDAKWLENLTSVWGDLRFIRLKDAKWLERLTTIWGKADFSGLTNTTWLENLTTIWGYTNFQSITNAEWLENLTTIWGDAHFDMLKDAKWLERLTTILGYRDFRLSKNQRQLVPALKKTDEDTRGY